MRPARRSPWRRLIVQGITLACAVAAPQAPAALHVYEPFDYPAASRLTGTPADALNLTGTYSGSVAFEFYELRISNPGLEYGRLAGTPEARGNKLTQFGGTTADAVSVRIEQPITVDPGNALFFSALLTLDDSRNGTHVAGVTLRDDRNGDMLEFGETVAGIRSIRVGAYTAGSGGSVVGTTDSPFVDGRTLLMMWRYSNATAAQADSLELIGYDTAVPAVLPPAFDPGDPQKAFHLAARGVDIDLTQVSSISFEIRGADNNFIDELRIGSSYADVAAIPEPHTWLLMVGGIAATAVSVRARRKAAA